MATQPTDFSKIVGLIMQNPALIEQIANLTKQGSDFDETAVAKESLNDPISEPEETVVSVPPRRDTHSHRHDLLGALKPYLSENRRAAIDSMISISDILGMMKNK